MQSPTSASEGTPTGESPPPAAGAPGGAGRRPLLIGLAAALVLVLAGLVVFAVTRGGEDDAATPAPPAASPSAPASSTPSAAATPEGVPLGVFQQTSASAVQDFESWLGRDVDYVVDFSSRGSWEEIANPTYLLREWQGTQHRLVLAVPMLPEDGGASMQQGASGEYDQYFRQLAERLVATDHADSILRVGWEFNLESWPWSTDDTEAFKEYFRRIVTAMRGVPGAQFEIDWNVNNGSNEFDATGYWPGDEYVDYVGVDAYDQSGRHYPYPANCDDTCRTQRQGQAWATSIFGGERGLRYWASFARDHDKKLSLPEWGLWERPDGTGGGDDPDFIRRMHEFITDPDNNVGYQAYFEHDGDDGRHSLADAFPQSGAVFKELFTG